VLTVWLQLVTSWLPSSAWLLPTSEPLPEIVVLESRDDASFWNARMTFCAKVPSSNVFSTTVVMRTPSTPFSAVPAVKSIFSDAEPFADSSFITK
jgi:hypothetical protein